jgi:hypothetical protein
VKGIILAEVVVAGLAGATDRAESGLDVVQIAGLGRGGQLAHLALHLLGGSLELGVVAPDLGLGAGVAGAGAFDEGGPRQLGHRLGNRRVGGGGIGVERRAAGRHGADATEVVRHDGQGRLAVLDGVFRLGELGLGGQGQSSSSDQGQRGNEFHEDSLESER